MSPFTHYKVRRPAPPPACIAVHHHRNGWCAAMMVWYAHGPRGFYTLREVGAVARPTRDEAVQDAREWAGIEGLECKL